jgi:NADPH2:quinone reductase|tara:strand:- start:3103 stop:4053 length:951 start_codon:yes stop_codon:yes gene_type:complete
LKSVVCSAIGEPVEIHTSNDPTPGPSEVLVRVGACGLNYVDALMCAGGYQIKPQLPFTPGSELAGTVTATGKDINDLKAGDRVLTRGGFVSVVARPRSSIYPIPSALTEGQAATLWQSYSTMLFAYARASLSADQTVLVLGASGGIGRAAIDLAHSRGARVIAAASSDDRLKSCGEVFGHINYSLENLKVRARELTKGDGVDVVVDPVGGDLANTALRALDYMGRYLVIGFAAGSIPQLPVNQILLRNRNVIGIDWGAWSGSHSQEQENNLRTLLTMAERGSITPPEPRAYAFEEAQTALDDLMNRRVVGKAILVP